MGYPRVVVLPFLLSLLFASSDGLITSSPSKVISFPRLQRLSVSLSNKNDKDSSNPKSASSSHNIPIWKKAAALVSKTAAMEINADINTKEDSKGVQLVTFLRVGVPSVLAGIASTFAFPGIAMLLASSMNSAGVFQVLSQDSSQFVQNFLTVAGLLFSILVGQTYYFMYQQQEAVYYALFNEVTEAKSLVEQVALVCQGRGMYTQVLKSISQYVRDDLKNLQADPAVLLSARPIDDPLESVMYMTSVGVPSSVYETVRSLRQARAGRLGALQRKLPQVHMLLLWILGLIELVSFPLLGAGTQTIGGYRILTVEGVLFGVMTFGIVMTLRVVGELWRPAGGAYNVDGVLRTMVRGLEEELDARMSGTKVYAASQKRPSSLIEVSGSSILKDGALPSTPDDLVKVRG
ncbi:hypothetical protein MHU86_3038 [Fragilaria crotonensis]|nr:hypothetical protein MHU86_3038 [Fragilaria crotonensis]